MLSVERDGRTQTAYSLICLDELVESQQAAVPTATVLRLQVHAKLVHYGSPAARKVVFDDGSQTHGQLGARETAKAFRSFSDWI